MPSPSRFLRGPGCVCAFAAALLGWSVAAPAVAALPSSLPSIAALSAAACRGGGEGAVLASPVQVERGDDVAFLATFPRAVDARLVVFDGQGRELAATEGRRGGPPYWWHLSLRGAGDGRLRALLVDDGRILACTSVAIGGGTPRALPADIVWPVEQEWDALSEDLYAAWLERLFDDPLDAQPSWRSLDEVTRDAGRNFLHNHLGLGEDDEDGLELEPDCADLPYFLRGYFAWKLGLPFGYSTCGSGGAERPPFCEDWHSNQDVPSGGSSTLARMQRFFGRDVAWAVHSAGARTAPEADRSDYYPVELTIETLRPGTVFVDPYGHVLVLARRLPQTDDHSGRLLAVDAQPDGTVARKTYWRGNFLFSVDPLLGGAGFKRFRPIVVEKGVARPVANVEIPALEGHDDFSFAQYEAGVDGFYEAVEDALSPRPRDVLQVFGELIDALDEQVGTRVRSVANGEDYMREQRGTMAMPDGADIFQTTGPWEDYATPARDLRLLIAIDVVRSFPERAARRPERYRFPEGTSAGSLRADLDRILEREAGARTFSYEGSDGTERELTLADVLARAEALEMAYNPNDCIEIRWGAPEGGDEMDACRRHAPASQRRMMDGFRVWFRERRRP
jgi:hypothetical protein